MQRDNDERSHAGAFLCSALSLTRKRRECFLQRLALVAGGANRLGLRAGVAASSEAAAGAVAKAAIIGSSGVANGLIST